MKILKSLAEKIRKAINQSNEVLRGDDMVTIETFIADAITNALEGDLIDWSCLQHLVYLEKSYEIVRVYVSREEYKTLMQKGNGDSDISFDDIMNFVLKNYLILFEVRMKKRILDKSWNPERIALALHKYGFGDGMRIRTNVVLIDCPFCGHCDFAVFPNTGLVHCHRATCMSHRDNADIWHVLQSSQNRLASIVNELYDDLILNYSSQILRFEEIEVQHTRFQNIENGNLEKIAGAIKPENEYMIRHGYEQGILSKLGVGSIGMEEIPFCYEANDFRHRVCFPIRDINGQLVGIQGRSIFDDEAERATVVDNDLVWRRMYWTKESWEEQDILKKSNKKQKLNQKIINTFGFEKSQHLYLLNEYAGLDAAERPQTVLVVEGIKDAIRVYEHQGIDLAVVASFGCELHDQQINLLKRVFGIDATIIMAYDADKAGRIGNLKAMRDLEAAGFGKIKSCMYVVGDMQYKDFGEIRENSKVIIREIITQSVSAYEYTFEMNRKGIFLPVYENAIGDEDNGQIQFVELFGCSQPITPVLQKAAQAILCEPGIGIEDKRIKLLNLCQKGLLVDRVFIRDLLTSLG